MVRRALGLPTQPRSFENSPAVGRVTVSSPGIFALSGRLQPLGNTIATSSNRLTFLLTCHRKAVRLYPLGADPERFPPYRAWHTSPDPRQWFEMLWLFDQYSGKRYRITTAGHHGNRQAARVKTYGDVIREYEFHPESKCADAKGASCKKQTVGLLQRRHVQIDLIKYIAKESNNLEDVEAGLIHSEQSAYTEYPDPRRDEWQTNVIPALRNIALTILEEQTGLSRRMLIKARTGRARPHPKNQEVIKTVLRKKGLL